MNFANVTYWLRSFNLMHFADKIKFFYESIKRRKRNNDFVKKNPNIALPPPYILFEAFQLDYEKYYIGGEKSASWVIDLAKPYLDLNEATILDWGCGPARVVRHLKNKIGEKSAVFGTDYNERTIDWCSKNIKNVSFEQNGINPPTKFSAVMFDLIYGISIFTHLSEENHTKWLDELLRISKKGGILIITTHGDAFKAKLTSAEKAKFERDEIIIRGNVIEGHRVFTAFQPKTYLENLFQHKVKVLKHIPGESRNWGIEQDIWILKNKI